MSLLVKVVTQNFGNERAKDIFACEQLGGYRGLRKAIGMDRSEIVNEVLAANLSGRGGAGFPAGKKWSFIPKDAQTVYLVINADEGEPGTFKDRWLMYWDPHRLIEGACIAGLAIGAHSFYIYIRGELVREAEILENALKQAYQRGYLGASMASSGWAMEGTVHRGAGAYICGEETSLLNSLEGRRGYPRLKPPYPAISGLFGQPTCVNNVETLMNIPTIVEKGGAWFCELGLPGDGGTRAVAISGHVKNPGVHEVPVGTSLAAIINEWAGGMRNPERALKAVIPGGTSMPVLLPDEIDVPYSGQAMMTSETIREVESAPGQKFKWSGGTLRSMPGSGAIVVIEEGTCIVSLCARIMRFYAHESCGQCTPCREGSGWLAKLCTRLARGNGQAGDVELLQHVARNIGGNTICALGDAVTWPMLAFLTKFRSEFEAKVAQ